MDDQRQRGQMARVCSGLQWPYKRYKMKLNFGKRVTGSKVEARKSNVDSGEL